MIPRGIRNAVLFPVVLVFCALFPLAFPICAQRPTGGTPSAPIGQRSSSPALITSNDAPVDVLVSVREPTGMPLAGHAVVKLSSEKGVHLTVSTRDNST